MIETTCVARLAAMATLPPAIETLNQAWLVPAAERLTDPREVGRLDEQFQATLVKILRAVIQRRAEPAPMLLRGHIAQSQSEVRKITLHALYKARSRMAGLAAGG